MEGTRASEEGGKKTGTVETRQTSDPGGAGDEECNKQGSTHSTEIAGITFHQAGGASWDADSKNRLRERRSERVTKGKLFVSRSRVSELLCTL